MQGAELPIVNRWTYEEAAILDVVVTHETLLNGNSGLSSIRFEVGGGSIWLGTEDRRPDSQQDFTIQIAGESEHSVLSRALRQIADQLDAAPHR